MGRITDQRATMIRSGLALLLIFSLLRAGQLTDFLSGLVRPLVMVALTVLGIDGSDHGDHLVVGRLFIPWTRDCAGFDVLLVLWALILWTWRHERLGKGFWWRLAASIPTALVANVARVLCIIGWRGAFYPAVESPQMHYFIGFLWLLPLLPLFLPPGGGRGRWLRMVEATYIAAALSLIAPQMAAPGGTVVALCGLLFIAGHVWRPPVTRFEKLWTAAWLAGAVFNTVAAMESLWLPWLLACPWFASRRLILSPAVLALAGTIPLVASTTWALAIWPIGLAWGVWALVRRGLPEPADPRLRWPALATLAPALLLPFVASTIGPALQGETLPPAGLMARQIEPGAYDLRLPGQSPEIRLTWHSPTGAGRHHTVVVCMAYRGLDLKAHPELPGVFGDDERWFAEAFLVENEKFERYDGYVRRTFIPFSPAGTHLIASARQDRMDPEAFLAEVDALIERIHALKLEDANAPG